MDDMSILFLLPEAKSREALRIHRLLGDLADRPYDKTELEIRAARAGVNPRRLKTWLDAYQRSGITGLEPAEWTDLTADEQEIAHSRYVQLQQYCDEPEISTADIAKLADELDWKFRRTKEWLDRYRNGGLWGLTPRFNPAKRKKANGPASAGTRDIATLDEAAIKIIFDRLEILGPLSDDRPASDDEVAARAAEVGVSPRTIRELRRNKKKHGLAGLAPKPRSDRGKSHKLSDRIEELVRALGLAYPEWPVHQIHTAATQKADELGELPPSVWQVRRIIGAIPKPIKLLASRRESEFKSLYRQTFPQNFEGIVYQIDHTPIDLLVKDQRNSDARVPSREIRPWLTTVMDSRSRCIIAFHLGYDRPDKHIVKAVIRASVLANPGGIPNRIRIDRGKDMVALEVQVLARELEIELDVLQAHQPQQKGIVERFFGTLNTRLWSTLPGYVSSDTKSRNPSVKAALTIQEVQLKLIEFIGKYHNEEHQSIGMPPLEFWRQNCFAMPVGDVHLLDLWMLSVEWRKIRKTGIRFGNRVYVHKELGVHVGEKARVRADTMFGPPDEIEVYINDRHVCSAFALDSERGHALQRAEMADYIRNQREQLRGPVQEAQEFLNAIDEEIEDAKPSSTQVESPDGVAADVDPGQSVDNEYGQGTQAKQDPPHSVQQPSKPEKKLDLLQLAALHLRTTKDENSE